jgi:uncharacterized protein
LETLDLVRDNLLSPIVLAFGLGAIATLVRSDLKIPEPVYAALSLYLLLAIGMKGGTALSQSPISSVATPIAWTLALGIVTPILAYNVLRRLGKFGRIDAAAIAAHYGSVSAVTFIACQSFLQASKISSEGFMPVLVAVLEVPAIIVALLIAKRKETSGIPLAEAVREIVCGKSILLLLGGVAIGYLAGPKGMERVAPVFVAPFQGALVIFLLDMGMLAANRLGDLKRVGPFLILFGVLMPLALGALGIWVGILAGLSQGGAILLGTMSASASYIAAPAAVRVALPEANPTYYLTASLAITFPFNLTFGIPLYALFTKFLFER